MADHYREHHAAATGKKNEIQRELQIHLTEHGIAMSTDDHSEHLSILYIKPTAEPTI